MRIIYIYITQVTSLPKGRHLHQGDQDLCRQKSVRLTWNGRSSSFEKTKTKQQQRKTKHLKCCFISPHAPPQCIYAYLRRAPWTAIPRACAWVLTCFSHIWLFGASWTVARQAPLSMGFSRQEYWSGLPLPSPGDLPGPGIEPMSVCLLHWQAGSLPLASPRKLSPEHIQQQMAFSSYVNHVNRMNNVIFNNKIAHILAYVWNSRVEPPMWQ